MPKIKPHRTVVITESTLKRLHACSFGLRAARPYLPAILSTDPEKNLGLAIKMARDEQNPSPFVGWLAEISGVGDEHPKFSERVRSRDGEDDLPPFPLDPYQVAQVLAHIADKKLSRRGR